MSQYLLIRLVLLAGMALLLWLLMRPSKTASRLALRRLAMMLIIVFAATAILFPSVLNTAAALLGVDRGINLLVYLLVLAVFAQMVTSHRREVQMTRLLTGVARAQALSTVTYPPQSDGAGTTGPDDGAIQDKEPEQ